MLKQLVTKVIGTRFTRELKSIQPIIDDVHEQEKRLAGLTDDEIRGQTARFRGRLKERVGDLEAALASTREAKHGCADPVERDALDQIGRASCRERV